MTTEEEHVAAVNVLFCDPNNTLFISASIIIFIHFYSILLMVLHSKPFIVSLPQSSSWCIFSVISITMIIFFLILLCSVCYYSFTLQSEFDSHQSRGAYLFFSFPSKVDGIFWQLKNSFLLWYQPCSQVSS